jgi:hypothetical protein
MDKWYGRRKTNVLGEEPVSMQLRPPQILHGLACDETRTVAMEDRRLNA